MKIKVGIIIYVEISDQDSEAVKLAAYKTLLDYIDTVLSTTKINVESNVDIKAGCTKGNQFVYTAVIKGDF